MKTRLWYFDRHGAPISMARCLELKADEAYKRIAFTELAEGSFVSTIWVGEDPMVSVRIAADANDPPVAPRIFETMARHAGEWIIQERHASEAEALVGHGIAVAAVRALVHELN